MRFIREHFAGDSLISLFRLFIFTCIISTASAAPDAETLQTIFNRAASLRAEKSYRLAREAYEQVIAKNPPAALAQPARVWAADTSWHENPNDAAFAEPAAKELENLAKELSDPRWRAEAAESLGDLRQTTQQWNLEPLLQAWLLALKNWQAVDTKESLERAIDLKLKIARQIIETRNIYPFPDPKVFSSPIPIPAPPRGDRPWEGDLATWLLRQVLEESKNPAQLRRANYLLGLQRTRYSPSESDALEQWRKEGEKYLRAAITVKPEGEETEDALFILAQFLNQTSRYVEAAKTLRDYLERFPTGKGRHADEAAQLLEAITSSQGQLGGGNAFAPASFIALHFHGRNLARGEVVIEQATPDALLDFTRANEEGLDWNKLRGKEVRRAPLKNLINDGSHNPQSQNLYLEPLPPGFYLARLDAPELPKADFKGNPIQHSPVTFIVSRLAFAKVIHTTSTLVWVADAETGAPKANAHVRILLRHARERKATRLLEGMTGAKGLVTLADPQITQPNERWLTALVLIEHDGDVALGHQGGGYYPNHHYQPNNQPFIIYAYADRPAYRPGELVQWKAILRRQGEHGYELPAEKTVRARIRDERGGVVSNAQLEISAYGTVSGAFTTSPTTALGVLSLELRDAADKGPLAGAPLCRLEEYKLPEYIVSVTPVAGQRQLGDAVPVHIKAEYYFGGPVAGATAEIVITRRPFWPWWSPWPFPWIEANPGFRQRGAIGRHLEFDNRFGRWPRSAPEENVLTQSIKLDERGETEFTLPAVTAADLKKAAEENYWGYDYTLEVRVTDASRREVSGSGTVKLARTAFAAYLTPERNVVLPNDPLRVALKTLDPNDQPVSAEGTAAFSRATWNEQKKNAKGEREPGYDFTLITTKPAGTTREAGEGKIEFSTPDAGFYQIKFTAHDAFGSTVTAETMAYVAKANDPIAGLRSGGVEIIPDKQFYTRGDTAEVLITTRRPGVDVLFAAEGQEILRDELIRVGEGNNTSTNSLHTATGRLVRVPITEKCEPRISFSATALYEWSAFQDQKSVSVPPTPQYLNLTLELPKAEFKPGERATVEVRATDYKNNPVATEFSLGVADAAVWAIGNDFVGDIRGHFWTSPPQGYRREVHTYAEEYVFQRWRPKSGQPGEFESLRRDEAEELTQASRERQADFFFNADAALAGGVSTKRMAMAAESVPQKAVGAPAASADAVPPPRLRTDFRSSALWLAHCITDANGRATAELTLPDSLTTWRATAIGVDQATRVGQIRTEIKTNLPLMVRPQGPRFLVAGDTAAFSAVINNATSDSQSVLARIDVAGMKPAAADQMRNLLATTTAGLRVDTPQTSFTLSGQSQQRLDWLLTADRRGTASVTLEARSAAGSDAVRKTYPILEYGAEQYLAEAATLRGPDETITRELKFTLPEARRAGSEHLTLWLEPTLARTMVNALPFLAQYPYGCTEQTLSRFVPAVTTARVLRELGLRRPELEAELPKMIAAGLERLYGAQHANGAWGWWKDGPDDAWMTAYVIAGLAEARAADVAVDSTRLERACAWLKLNLAEHQAEPDMVAFMLYGLALNGQAASDPLIKTAHDKLWPQRDQLNPYTRALLALACHRSSMKDRVAVLLRNMRNGLVEDKANGTAHWGTSGVYYRWSEGGIEATSFGLRALLAIDPKSDLIEPLLTWLVRNRKGSRWQSTRDTAIVIGALADAVRSRGEDKPDWTAEVRVNGQMVTTLRVTPQNLWETPEKIEVDAKALRSGENTISITRQGSGVLYAAAGLLFFNQAEKIEPAGHELFITRQYYRESAPQKPLQDGDLLASGERVEVRLSIEAKNHYEYILIEDPKPAGLEPVELQSGYGWEGKIGFQREWRDDRTALFIDRLPEGKHELKYIMRAEIPGRFHSLPTQICAMYVPDLRGNGGNQIINIRDALVVDSTKD